MGKKIIASTKQVMKANKRASRDSGREFATIG
jgi:hypothetical protein